MDSQGIRNVDETSIATKERAFLDMIYINSSYHFDNIRSVNWDMVFELLPIYRNQRMANKVMGIYKQENR